MGASQRPPVIACYTIWSQWASVLPFSKHRLSIPAWYLHASLTLPLHLTPSPTQSDHYSRWAQIPCVPWNFPWLPSLFSTPSYLIITLHNLPLNYLLPCLIIQSMPPLTANASPESLLEIQTFGPHPWPTESESAFYQHSQWYSCTWKFGKHHGILPVITAGRPVDVSYPPTRLKALGQLIPYLIIFLLSLSHTYTSILNSWVSSTFYDTNLTCQRGNTILWTDWILKY